jgi:predicted MFS family arabinose efflux permease
MLPGMNLPVSLFLLYNGLLHIGLLGVSDAILNFYFVSLGHNQETIGLLQALPRLGGFAISVPVGLLANRIGTRRIVIFSTLGLTASYLMIIVWPSLFMLGFSRLLMGLFWGGIQIATTPLLIRLSTAQFETYVFSYLNVVTMGTTAVGSFVGGYLPLLIVTLFPGAVDAVGVPPEQTAFAYRAALLLGTVTVVAAFWPLHRLQDDGPTAVAHRSPGTAAQRTPWLQITGLASPMLIFGFTGGLTFPFYNLFFRTTFDVPDKTVGTILSIGWLGMAVIPLVGPGWERSLGRTWALGVALVIAAGAFYGLSVAPTLAFSVVCFVGAISFRNMMQPLFQPLLMDTLAPSLHNITSGVSTVLWNVGWFTATAMSGFLQTTYGFGVIMQIVAGGVLLNAVIVVLIFRRRRPHWQAQQVL